MSDFFKNLKSLFVEDGSTATPKAESIPESEKPSESKDDKVKKEVEIPVETQGPVKEGEVSPKFTKILLKAIEKHNQEGFDYLEYKNSIRSLSKMTMDEATKFQSAYAMSQTMGASSKALIQSALHYQKVLTEEKKKFDQAAGLQMKRKVEDKKRELRDWEAQITSKEKQIEKLQAEINALRSKISKVNDSLATEEGKVIKTQADFVASFNNLYNQISADIEKMTKYLK